MATRPLLYISYGMAKSGSTLAYNLVVAVLEAAGRPQPQIDLPDVIVSGSVNFVEVIRPTELTALVEHAEGAFATPVAIKTHCGMWDCMKRALDEGVAIGHAIARDPREVALSMMDASRENRAWGKRHGEPLRHIEDALEAVRHNAEKFEKWAAHPAILPLSYNRVAFDTEATAQRIADQLGVEVDAARCAKAALKMGANFNRGVPRRHEDEMSEAVNERIRQEFEGFIEKHCDDAFRPRPRSLLGRLIGR